MNNNNEDQLPRWINTIRRSLSPYPQTMSACECGQEIPAVSGGMCLLCAGSKLAFACGEKPVQDYLDALYELKNAQIKYDEYKSKQTKS